LSIDLIHTELFDEKNQRSKISCQGPFKVFNKSSIEDTLQGRLAKHHVIYRDFLVSICQMLEFPKWLMSENLRIQEEKPVL
jgi:hypothetical protein